MKLERICLPGVESIYAISNLKKEFRKAVNDEWRDNPPWQRYQKRLMQDLAVLDQEKERAIDLPQFEMLNGSRRLYSIRHPETKKNVRILYTIINDNVILLTAFLEKTDGDYQNAIKTAQKRLRWLEN